MALGLNEKQTTHGKDEQDRLLALIINYCWLHESRSNESLGLLGALCYGELTQVINGIRC